MPVVEQSLRQMYEQDWLLGVVQEEREDAIVGGFTPQKKEKILSPRPTSVVDTHGSRSSTASAGLSHPMMVLARGSSSPLRPSL